MSLVAVTSSVVFCYMTMAEGQDWISTTRLLIKVGGKSEHLAFWTSVMEAETCLFWNSDRGDLHQHREWTSIKEAYVCGKAIHQIVWLTKIQLIVLSCLHALKHVNLTKWINTVDQKISWYPRPYFYIPPPLFLRKLTTFLGIYSI